MSANDEDDFLDLDPKNQTQADIEYYTELGRYFEEGPGTIVDKLRNFPKYSARQWLGLFAARYELMKLVVPVHGYIVECGVYLGGGVFTWAQLSSLLEPINHHRRVVGFDTFAGFNALHAKDEGQPLSYKKAGGLKADCYEDLMRGTELYDMTRPIGHIPRMEFVKGDACETIPEYIRSNPHLVVSMLYLDFDLYEPTKIALELLVPRMPRGAVLAFDELAHAAWPGETQAVLDTIGVRSLEIRRFPFVPQLSYAVLD